MERLVTVIELVMQGVVIVPDCLMPSLVLAPAHEAASHVTVQRIMLALERAVPPIVLPIELSVRAMMPPPSFPVARDAVAVSSSDIHSA